MQNYVTCGHQMKSESYHGFGADDDFDSELNTESSFEQKTFKDDMVRWNSLPRNVFTEMIQKNCQEMLKYRSTAKVSRAFWNSLCLNPIFDRICIK